MTKITTLIVDDEPVARRRVRRLLGEDPEVEVSAECGNGRDAVEAIDRLSPDLVFLDVQMPELDGFGVLAEMAPARRPVVVFVTAYDEYALRAFEVHAVDYLLKPFDRERFAAALSRAKALVRASRTEEYDRRLAALAGAAGAGRGYARRLVIRSEGEIFFVRAADVDWIEAEKNYVRVHTRERTYRLRETMSALEERLDPAEFMRIHRSAIVNVDRIKEMHPYFHGEYQVTLRDGTRLVWSRSYRDRLEQLLRND